MNAADTFNSLFSLFTDIPTDINIFWNLISLLFFIGFFVYSLFAVLVVKQVFMMTATFKTTAGPLLKVFAFLHLIFALAIIFFAFLVLF